MNITCPPNFRFDGLTGIDFPPFVPPGHPLYGKPVCYPINRCGDKAREKNEAAIAAALAQSIGFNPVLYRPAYNEYGCYDGLSETESPHVTRVYDEIDLLDNH